MAEPNLLFKLCPKCVARLRLRVKSKDRNVTAEISLPKLSVVELNAPWLGKNGSKVTMSSGSVSEISSSFPETFTCICIDLRASAALEACSTPLTRE